MISIKRFFQSAVMQEKVLPFGNRTCEGRIPCFGKGELVNCVRANKYLHRQHNRFIKLVAEGNIRGAFRVYKFLVCSSLSFRIHWFNKVSKGGYHNLTSGEVMGKLRSLNRIIHTWDPNLNSRRVYIPKSNGKLRPLGVPALEGRILCSMGAYMLRCLVNANINEHQHGFIPGRNLCTAIKDLYNLGWRYQYKYEFDLESCFNRIEIEAVDLLIKEKLGLPEEFANYVRLINSMAPRNKVDELELDDPEVFRKVVDDASVLSGTKGGIYSKRGLPQGLPGSPILAVGVLDQYLVKRHPDVKFLMYADDGIMLSNSKESINKVISDFKLPFAGIYFSNKLKKDGSPSCGYINGVNAKFLNAEINFETGIVQTQRGLCHVNVEDGMFMKILWSDYNVVKEGKGGDVSGSYLELFLKSQSLGHGIQSILKYYRSRTMNVDNRSMGRVFQGNRPYRYNEMSSKCCEMLIKQLKNSSDKTTFSKRGLPFNSIYRYRDVESGFALLESIRRVPKDLLFDPSFRDRLINSDFLGVFTTEIIGEKRILSGGCSPYLVDYMIRRELIIRRTGKTKHTLYQC